jgi:hypothetical protein
MQQYLLKIREFSSLQLRYSAYHPNRIDENDKKNFERIMKLHPRFPEVILAFKEEPDAYDNFIAMVSFFELVITAYMH